MSGKAKRKRADGDGDDECHVSVTTACSTVPTAYSSATVSELYVPGQVITGDQSFLRGHGTYLTDGVLRSSVCGLADRVNKLITVRPVRGRYAGAVGDVVVGRVVEVAQTRWKVDIGGIRYAVLLLNSINLPGGVQRRRTAGDQLEMRSFFQEDDVISAEVHSFFKDGSMALHSRSLKYGKLKYGRLVRVPSGLVRRAKTHFASLPGIGVDVILAVNGYLWVSPTTAKEQGEAAVAVDERETQSVLVRVCACLRAMADESLPISAETIMRVYNNTLPHAVKDLMVSSVRGRVCRLEG